MSETMPQEFWQGVEQFNSGQFYACHDTLEALWIEAIEPEKTFYQGILQIAVALYHLRNENLRGAAILLGEGSNRLRRYPDSYGGINVDELLSQSAELLTVLQQTSVNKISASELLENQNLPIPKLVLSNDC
ncbi:hypothetical protein ACX27_17200 [Nostoc piscinale CENA21]|uniref:DUF309 domain-containing protein n=1 Tax=Nostoc piscinale CENA21 TaxID=224013 RepID=A0A0M4T3C4_9NOSO|nr:DUF309 domain-containing protein [Nostoc piscinale]ALF54182.1 hypothetical protein ACX27_17200 [Nostoc piscinale CENA21]